jgi:hypothetical protein
MESLSLIGGALTGYFIYRAFQKPLGKPEKAFEHRDPHKNPYSDEKWDDTLLCTFKYPTSPKTKIFLRKGVPGQNNYLLDIGGTGTHYLISPQTLKEIQLNSGNVEIFWD